MVKMHFKETWIWLGLRFNEYRSLNLNTMLKIEFWKIKFAYGLIKHIKGYLIFFVVVRRADRTRNQCPCAVRLLNFFANGEYKLD
jgi:hypothetical protein